MGFLTIGFIDRTSLREKDYYRDMMAMLDTAKLKSYSSESPVMIGWSKVNITPDKPTPMAGYSPKETFTNVADSLYVRTMVVDNGATKVAFISADLLIFPPEVENRINELKELKKLDHYLYLGATHSHSSIGGWDKTMAGQITMGDYDPSLVDALAQKTIFSIEKADKEKQTGTMKFIKAHASEYIKNRLNEDSKVDGYMRGLEIETDEKKAYLLSYGAHPTNLPMKSTALSNDYPGALIRNLESSENVAFAMFFAGMLGSQNIKAIEGKNEELVNNAGRILSSLILQTTHEKLDSNVMIMHHNLPVHFPEPQMRLTANLKVRPWVYESFFNELSGKISLVKFNNILFLGLPADFSGEVYTRHLSDFVQKNNMELVITGFNGDYVGYIVDEKHYDRSKKEEVMIMNWLGPYSDTYFVDIIKKIITKVNN